MNAEAATVSLPGEREGRERLFRALADELVVSDRRAVVLTETSTGGRRPRVTVRPAELLASTLARLALDRCAGPADERIGPEQPPSAQVSWAFVPALEPGSVATPARPHDPPEARTLLGPGGRIDVQTLWLAGRTDGRLWVSRRARFSAGSDEELAGRGPTVARYLAGDWSRSVGRGCRARPIRLPPGAWRAGGGRGIPREAWLAVGPERAAVGAEPTLPSAEATVGGDGHLVVLGASGAGKTTLVAERAAAAIRRGQAVVAVDLHGDLAPAIVGRLAPEARAKIVAVDVDRRPVVGVAALAGLGDRAAAQFVAAVKRLSPDGSEVYWGFRLERVFDAFVRLVQESGGSLADLYRLLTDADRREAARLATRSVELGRFLDELGPIVRRSPEFLWSAAARLAKVVLVPELAELLAPADGGVPVEEVVGAGRSLLVRIPFSTVGPEAAAFAGSMVLARTYLGLAARRGATGVAAPVLVVLDEVQGLSPRLVAEMLTEGRKFGLRLVVATQYPERLAPELRHAAAGVGRGVVVFRVPPASASSVGPWLGLGPMEAERILTGLPVGIGVARGPGASELQTVGNGGSPGMTDPTGWSAEVERTAAEFAAAETVDPCELDEGTEQLLLTALAAEERGAPVPCDRLVPETVDRLGPAADAAVLGERALALERDGSVRRLDGTWRLTPTGERRLGLRTTTGASRESAEHRALLLRSFRIFARHGARLEIVRQGRYDTTLPDAIFRQIPDRRRLGPPPELAAAIASAGRHWPWRFFGGRDVHVEAEVSGALRPSRIRHGLDKAVRRGAFALFVVGDARRASKVRRTLRAEGVGVDRAQVWTLRDPASAARTTAAQERKAGEPTEASCGSSSPSMLAPSPRAPAGLPNT